MSDEVAASRAKFWPRALALLIDATLISFVLAVAGLLLFGPTDGKVRVSSTLVYSTACENLNAQQLAEAGAALPDDFRPTVAARCTRSLLGHVFDRDLIVVEVKQSGSFSSKRELSFATDRSGRVVDAFYLDNWWFVLFAVYVVLLEWRFGRTLGKDLAYLRVRSTAADIPPTVIQTLKRFFARFLPFILGIVVVMSPMMSILFSSVPALAVTWLLLAGMVVAILINFIITTRHGQLPWHDRIARTEVVPATSASAAGQIASPAPPSV